MAMNESKGAPRGPRPIIQWMLQIEGGRLLGPLKTEEVIFRISEGILSGEEKIKQHPNGQWTTVSREPIFYDQLLDALQKKVDENKIKKENRKSDNENTEINISNKVSENKIEKNDVKSILQPLPENTELEKIIHEQNKILLPELKSENLQIKKINLAQSNQPKSSYNKNQQTSLLEKIKGKIYSVSLKTMKTFVLAIVSLSIILFIFLSLIKTESKYIQLKFPKPATKVSMSEAQQKKLLDQAFKDYFLDQISSYLSAQNNLVELIEGNPQSVQARGLLCLVHKELWPFVRQDSRDIDVFQISRKGARLIDPVGENGTICEIIFLMIMGKYQNAMGLVDHYTNNPNNEVSPFLYLIKSELYAADKKYKDAIAYANDVASKIPYWAKPTYLLANYYEDTNQIEKSVEYFGNLFRINPKHRSGFIDYGGMMYAKVQNPDEALKALKTAEKMNTQIAKSNESKMHFYLAKIYFDKKNHDKALDHARDAFQLNPADLRARDLLISLGGSPNIQAKSDKNNELVFLGDQYYRAGDCLSASAEYMAAFDFDQQNAFAATKAGRCLWQLSQIEKAFVWLGKAIQADSKLSWPYFLLADYYSQRFNFVDAIQILTKGAQKIPNNAEILKGYGLVEYRRNNFKEAINYLERSRKVFENDPETLVLLSKAYSAKSAVTDFEKGMQMAIKAIELEDTNSDAHVSYANILVQTKGVESGASYIKELTKKYSYNQEFRLCLAQIYKETERYNDAKEIFEYVIINDDKNKQAMIGLGESYQGLGQFTQAINFFLKAAVIDPADPVPLMKVGYVYLEAGRAKEAINQFERARKLNPNFPRVNYMLGRASYGIKDFKNALQYAANEKQYNPNLADPYILSGEIYTAINDYAKCTKEYEMAIKLRPEGAENYVKLAICHLSIGNLDIAESLLNIANTKESGFAEIYKIQGEVFERKGERDSAVQAYTKYTILSPNAVDKKIYERKIEKLGGGK